jgi:hypothetical protein
MKILKILPVLAALLLLVSVAGAQGNYELLWWSVDGGGTTSSQGGGYLLSGTIGQPEGGELSSPSYTLDGGVWRGGEVLEPRPTLPVYLPLVVR